jgi:hypothetical protein
VHVVDEPIDQDVNEFLEQPLVVLYRRLTAVNAEEVQKVFRAIAEAMSYFNSQNKDI